MSISIFWKLHSENLAELEVEDGTLQDVICVVHWRCIASDGDVSAEIYGSHDIPAPKTTDGYIPIDAIKNMEPVQRRETILGWAELIDPGFVLGTEQLATDKLQEKLNTPVITKTEII